MHTNTMRHLEYAGREVTLHKCTRQFAAGFLGISLAETVGVQGYNWDHDMIFIRCEGHNGCVHGCRGVEYHLQRTQVSCLEQVKQLARRHDAWGTSAMNDTLPAQTPTLAVLRKTYLEDTSQTAILDFIFATDALPLDAFVETTPAPVRKIARQDHITTMLIWWPALMAIVFLVVSHAIS